MNESGKRGFNAVSMTSEPNLRAKNTKLFLREP